jgi:hypothetical protein
MDQQNRVLVRIGARELTPTEADLVNGGYRTLSLCTSAPTPDGDQHVGEVGRSHQRLHRWPSYRKPHRLRRWRWLRRHRF